MLAILMRSVATIEIDERCGNLCGFACCAGRFEICRNSMSALRCRKDLTENGVEDVVWHLLCSGRGFEGRRVQLQFSLERGTLSKSCLNGCLFCIIVGMGFRRKSRAGCWYSELCV